MAINRPSLEKYGHKFSTPLLDPPNGMIWVKDHYCTHEWVLMGGKSGDLLHSFDASKSVTVDLSVGTTNKEKSIRHDNENDEAIQCILEHIILPTDTFVGICLSYKISATKLRQINRFSGTNLALAPRKLLIPVSRQYRSFVKLQNHNCKEFKVYCLLAEVPQLSKLAARAYLNMTELDLCKAIHEATSDLEWEELQEVTRATFAGVSVQDRHTTAATRYVKPRFTLVNKKIECEEEWFEMKSMTTMRSNECLSLTSSSDSDDESFRAGDFQHGHTPPLLPIGKIRKAEIKPHTLIKTLVLDPGLSLYVTWCHLISTFNQSDKSSGATEYEMQELHHHSTKIKVL